MALNLCTRTAAQPGLFPIEKIGLAYNLLTACLIGILFPALDRPTRMLIDRVVMTVAMLLLWALYKRRPCKLTAFLRTGLQLSFLSYWYPETYEFNRLFPNLDHLFASAEQALFHLQPSLAFSQACPSIICSEAFNLGYFSYYPMIVGVMVFYFLFRYRLFQRSAFILVASFFLYYLIYIFLPVAGPQYYFPAVGLDEIAAGHFPALGDYFNAHTELLPAPGHAEGLFYQLVDASQQAGERPTAAFPSSHVGISTLLLILSWQTKRSLFFFLLPFYALLCCATVYIQAHYLIDALAGFVTAFGAYAASAWMYRHWFGPKESRRAVPPSV